MRKKRKSLIAFGLALGLFAGPAQAQNDEVYAAWPEGKRGPACERNIDQLRVVTDTRGRWQGSRAFALELGEKRFILLKSYLFTPELLVAVARTCGDSEVDLQTNILRLLPAILEEENAAAGAVDDKSPYYDTYCHIAYDRNLDEMRALIEKANASDTFTDEIFDGYAGITMLRANQTHAPKRERCIDLTAAPRSQKDTMAQLDTAVKQLAQRAGERDPEFMRHLSGLQEELEVVYQNPRGFFPRCESFRSKYRTMNDSFYRYWSQWETAIQDVSLAIYRSCRERHTWDRHVERAEAIMEGAGRR